MCVRQGGRVVVRDTFQVPVLASYHVGWGNWTQAIRPASRSLYPLSQLTSLTHKKWKHVNFFHQDLKKDVFFVLLLCEVMSFIPAFSCIRVMLCFHSFFFSNALPNVPANLMFLRTLCPCKSRVPRPRSGAFLVSAYHGAVRVLGLQMHAAESALFRSSCLWA